MLFTNYDFFVFLFIVFAAYYSLKKDLYQRILLLLAGFIFYAFNYPLLIILLLVSIFFNSYVSYAIVYFKKANRKQWATLGVVFNLGILVFFKYSPLIALTFLPVNFTLTDFLIAIPLPIGISFYTFEGISLVVDMYRAKEDSFQHKIVDRNFVKHLINTALFESFFPHLISGPIVRASDFVPQIAAKSIKNIQWAEAIKTLILGYFLKTVIADNLSTLTATIQYPAFLSISSFNLVVMLLGYSFQIFADFQGYSLIAIGLGLLFGYRLHINFNFPYISSTFSEFWNRWHITLSSWLKEYLYFSLGGNRGSKARTYINLFLVMFLGGLWHGAAWSYAIWGSMHGLLLSIERLLQDYKIKATGKYKIIGWFIVFTMVSYAWLFFKLTDIRYAIKYTQAFYQNRGIFPDYHSATLILLFGAGVVLYHLAYLFNLPQKEYFKKSEPYLYALMLFLITVESGMGGAFIYFQF